MLTNAGVIRRVAQGHQVYFQANQDSPVFRELKSLITKTIGVAETLRSALVPISDRIIIALVYGSIAKGEESQRSDVDVLVVGDVGFTEVITALRSAQETLGREINPTVYPADEFRSKVAENNYFIRDVLDGPKICIVGDENELRQLVE